MLSWLFADRYPSDITYHRLVVRNGTTSRFEPAICLDWFASTADFQDLFFCSVLDSNPSAGMCKVGESTRNRAPNGLTLLAANRFGRCFDGRIIVSQF